MHPAGNDSKTTRRPAIRASMVLALAAASAIGAAGCKHRRSAYRPVIVDREPVLVTPSPSGPSVIPSEPAPSYIPHDEYGAADPYGPPVSPPAGAYLDEEPDLGTFEMDPVEPAPSPRDEEAIRSDVEQFEPRGLDPEGEGRDFERFDPGSLGPDNPINGPLTRNRDGIPGGPRTQRAALRSRVQALADDPLDLVEPPKAQRPWRYIVLHHSDSDEGGYAQIDRAHRERGGLEDCGYHFVIGNGTGSPDGRIEVTRRWSDQRAGAHCRDASHPHVNDYGIGICLVGDLDGGPPTSKQVESARALVAYLKERYAIPDGRAGTHAMLAGRRTNCPGTQFPAEQILGRPNLASR